jgi:hypothetical protein
MLPTGKVDVGIGVPLAISQGQLEVQHDDVEAQQEGDAYDVSKEVI